MKILIVLVLAAMLSIPSWSPTTTDRAASGLSSGQQIEKQLTNDFCLRKDAGCKVVSWNS